MKPQTGFTIIEVMTAGILSTVLAGVVITLIVLTSEQIEASLSRQKAVARYEIVAEEVRKVARKAYTVRSTSEPEFTIWPPGNAGSLLTSQNGLKFYDRTPVAGVPNCIGGFEFQGVAGGLSILREWKAGAFTAFLVGGDSVFVTPSLQFSRDAARRVITFEIYVRYLVDESVRELKVPTQTVYLRGN